MADAPVRLMDGVAFDFFLIEMVNTLRVSSAHAQARARKVEQEMIDAGLLPAPLPALAIRKNHKDSTTSLASKATTKVDDEEEGLKLRLEAIGMHVGANITERYEHLFHSVPLTPLYTFFIDCVTENRTFPRHSKASSLFAKIYGRRAGISRWTTSGQIIGSASAAFYFFFGSYCGLGCVCFTRQFIQTYRSIILMGWPPGCN